MHFQCPRPTLTQLQARFVASLAATLFLIAVYLFVNSANFAYAQHSAELNVADGVYGGDHNWYRLEYEEEEERRARELFGATLNEDAAREILLGSTKHETQHVQLDLDAHDETPTSTRQYEKRTASTTASTLPGNNTPAMATITAGEVQQWIFPSSIMYGAHGVQGKGLPGGFLAFENVGDDEVDFYDAELEGGDSDNSTSERIKRDDSELVMIFISINVCTQPEWTGVGVSPGPPPQLTMYIAQSGDTAGPDAAEGTQEPWGLDEGFASVAWNTSAEVYFAIYANTTDSGYEGGWTYSIAGSIDDYYYDSDTGASPLYLVDTDTDSALLVTDNVTQVDPSDPVYTEWMDLNPVPFVAFGQSFSQLDRLVGMRQSYCAMKTLAQIAANPADATSANAPVQMEMTTRGLGTKPKEQFYMRGLNGSEQYQVFLAMEGNSSASGAGVIGGGGKMWTATNITTKSNGNCALLFSLDFCDTVAYAVPSNPYTYPNITALGEFYDNYASLLYTNFSLSLQLIPCNATSTSKYSLAQDCDDCAAAYKAWLCAVTIPRCMDYTAIASINYLQPRNVGQKFINNASFLPESELTALYNPMSAAPYGSIADQIVLQDAMAANQSRVARIDEMVQPGPYAELLPCEDLCFDLVRNCPAALGFACPFAGRGLERSYGKRTSAAGVSCSFAGAVYMLGDAGRTAPSLRVIMALGTAVAMMLL